MEITELKKNTFAMLRPRTLDVVYGLIMATVVALILLAANTLAHAQSYCVGPNCPPQRAIFDTPPWRVRRPMLDPFRFERAYQEPVIVQRMPSATAVTRQSWVPRSYRWRPRMR